MTHLQVLPLSVIGTKGVLKTKNWSLSTRYSLVSYAEHLLCVCACVCVWGGSYLSAVDTISIF